MPRGRRAPARSMLREAATAASSPGGAPSHGRSPFRQRARWQPPRRQWPKTQTRRKQATSPRLRPRRPPLPSLDDPELAARPQGTESRREAAGRSARERQRSSLRPRGLGPRRRRLRRRYGCCCSCHVGAGLSWRMKAASRQRNWSPTSLATPLQPGQVLSDVLAPVSCLPAAPAAL